MTRRLVFLMVLAASGWAARAADRPDSPFYFPKFRPEVFYDNGVVPEDVEVRLHPAAARTQRVYFLLEKEGRPLTLTVTPCSQPIKWRLSFGSFPLPGRKESRHDSLPESGGSRQSTELASYEGAERKIYGRSRNPAGLYALEVESPDSDADVRVHVTTRTEPDAYYPRLPADSRVSVLKVRRNKVLLAWKASPSESGPGRTLSYCVSVGRVAHRRSLCSLESHPRKEVPTLPPSAGFGFSWEKSDRKQSEAGRAAAPEERSNLTCVGRKTWHVFRGLQRGTAYYFDVFAVDSRTNASSAYDGIRATTKRSKSLSRLKDSSLVTLSLDADNGYAASVKYVVAAPAKKLWIFVQSCTGPGPVSLRVTKDGREISSSEVMDTKTLSLVPPSNGTYHLSVSSASKSLRRVRLWAGKKYHKLPFPVLPEDRSVKIFDTLTTCDSVTLAWHSTVDEKVKYCVYKRTAKAGFMRLFASPQNFCRGSEEAEEGRERILCRRYHRFSRQRFNNVIMQRVRNLKPSSTYIFDVRVTKHEAKSLSYERVWVTTAGNCSSSKGRR